MTNGKQDILRVALYVRTNKEALSENRQRKKMSAFCASQGYELQNQHIYKDIGISGVIDVNERPALKKMLQGIKNGELDLVIVERIDRLSQNLRELLKIISIFQKHRVELQSATEAIDITTPAGMLMLQTLGASAEHEHCAQKCVNGGCCCKELKEYGYAD